MTPPPYILGFGPLVGVLCGLAGLRSIAGPAPSPGYLRIARWCLVALNALCIFLLLRLRQIPMTNQADWNQAITWMCIAGAVFAIFTGPVVSMVLVLRSRKA